MSNADSVLRQQLRDLLHRGNAHMTFEEAVAHFPAEFMNARPPHVPYTPWHLLEHLRITQWDILEFVRNARHVSPPWPDGYWPTRDAEADAQTWQHTIAAFQADKQALIDIVADPQTDL